MHVAIKKVNFFIWVSEHIFDLILSQGTPDIWEEMECKALALPLILLKEVKFFL